MQWHSQTIYYLFIVIYTLKSVSCSDYPIWDTFLKSYKKLDPADPCLHMCFGGKPPHLNPGVYAPHIKPTYNLV